jgi:hypothetical protein
MMVSWILLSPNDFASVHPPGGAGVDTPWRTWAPTVIGAGLVVLGAVFFTPDGSEHTEPTTGMPSAHTAGSPGSV